ncbi:MAG: hypothetical protein CFE43_08155 [Burkholderiales bacterium PBB3]|nr:MAG: hypothetical protein CFE43_08155 [Burkholderiales bacterium PBB3]
MRITNFHAILFVLCLNFLPGARQAIAATVPSTEELTVLFPLVGTELGEVQKTHRVLPVSNGVHVYSGTVASFPFASMILVEGGRLAQSWISILVVGSQVDIDHWRSLLAAMNIPLADPKEVQEQAYCLGYAPTLQQRLNPFQFGKTGNTYFEGVQRLVGRDFSVISLRTTSFSNNSPVLKGYFESSKKVLSEGGQVEGANVLSKYIEQVFSPPESREECQGPLRRVNGPTLRVGLTKAQSKSALIALTHKRKGTWSIKIANNKVFAKVANSSEPEIAIILDDYDRASRYQETYLAEDTATCTKLYLDLNTSRVDGHIEVRHRYVERKADGYRFRNTNYYSSSHISQSWSEPKTSGAGCEIELQITL